MSTPAWSTQQLAEFLAAVSSAHTEATAALAAVEGVAEAFDAEVAAIVRGHELVAAVGYPEDSAPLAELESAAAGARDSQVPVPGVGMCAAKAVPLEHPSGAMLVVARSGPDGLSRVEESLLRGMARATSMTMQMLRLLDDERAAREDVERLAREQAALRRVATLVARSASPTAVFATVAEELGRLLSVDRAGLCRYDGDKMLTVVGGWSSTGEALQIGESVSLGGHNAVTRVFETGCPTRIEYLSEDSNPATTKARDTGGRAAVGAPINVAGRLWGAAVVVTRGREALPADTEARLADFTGLVATAIANAESHAELSASRVRIVTAADEERGRVVRDLHDGAQQHLVHALVTLKLARQALTKSVPDAGKLLDDAQQYTEEANLELRELVHGILPLALRRGGLRAGVEAVVSRMSLPVSVDVTDERFPAGIESTAYFVVSEALTNVTKHAHATSAEVTASVEDAVLRVEIVDDGVGSLRRTGISGLSGLEDRVSALEGSFIVESPPGQGTRVRALLSLPDRD